MKRARRLFGVNSLADFSLQLLYISFLERCAAPAKGCAEPFLQDGLIYAFIHHCLYRRGRVAAQVLG
jgi:hypothetical protein